MLSVYSQLWTNFDQLALDGGAWRLGLGFCRDGLVVHLDRVGVSVVMFLSFAW